MKWTDKHTNTNTHNRVKTSESCLFAKLTRLLTSHSSCCCKGNMQRMRRFSRACTPAPGCDTHNSLATTDKTIRTYLFCEANVAHLSSRNRATPTSVFMPFNVEVSPPLKSLSNAKVALCHSPPSPDHSSSLSVFVLLTFSSLTVF